MKSRYIVMTALSLSLAGCYGSDGPPQIVTANGVAPRKAPPVGTTVTGSLVTAFQQTALDAAPPESVARASGAAVTPETVAEIAARKVAAAKMLEAGFALVDADCNDFFVVRKRDQTRSNVARSSIAPISAALGGIIGLVNFKENDADRYITALALGTAVAKASLDIHTEHFLFGADNVQDVRDLTFKGIAASEEKIRDKKPDDYYAVIRLLIGHQDVCTPGNIARLAKAAIKAGEVEAADNGDGKLTDAEVMVELGKHFGLSGAPTSDQMTALSWLREGNLSVEAQNKIGEMLAGLGSANPLTGNGTTWTYSPEMSPVDKAKIGRLFASLSETARNDLEKRVSEKKAQVQALVDAQKALDQASTPAAPAAAQGAGGGNKGILFGRPLPGASAPTAAEIQARTKAQSDLAAAKAALAQRDAAPISTDSSSQGSGPVILNVK